MKEVYLSEKELLIELGYFHRKNFLTQLHVCSHNMSLSLSQLTNQLLQGLEEDHLLRKRQADTTEMMDEEGSGEPVELLVEQPKTGASLGQILGTTNFMEAF